VTDGTARAGGDARPVTQLRATGPMGRAAGWVAALAGWRRQGLAGLLGAMAALALPPSYAVPFLLVAFTGLLWLIDASRNGRAAGWIGWWFGFGYFVVGLYWIGISMLIDPARFGWMIPFAVGGLSAVEALFPALAALVTWRLAAPGLGRVLMLAASWTLAEWLRGIAFSGFPWNLLGSVWVFSDAMIQVTAIVGTLGLGLLTVIVAAMPALLVTPGASPQRHRRWRPVIAAAALLLAVWLFGVVRLSGAAAGVVPGVVLRIVQPDIAQTLKWRRDRLDRNFRDTLTLSEGPGRDKISAVIWPETAAPYVLSVRPRRRLEIAAATPPGGVLITGAVRTTAPGARPFRIWNSLYAIDDKGRIRGVYDKNKLVPFGEYIPFRGVLKRLGLSKLTPGALDFTAGKGRRTLRLPGLPPAAALICYEVIFSGRVVNAEDRPDWLINITNDAWFGDSSGPYQHFAAARLRAVEEGLPLVRAANTGISGVIDGYGRVTARLGLGRRGILDAPLPKKVKNQTFFSRYGMIIPLISAVLIGGMGGFVSGSHRRWIQRDAAPNRSP